MAGAVKDVGGVGEGDWHAELDEVRSLAIEERHDRELEAEVGPIPRAIPAKLKPSAPRNGTSFIPPPSRGGVSGQTSAGRQKENCALFPDARSATELARGEGERPADPFSTGLHVDEGGHALERDARAVMRTHFENRDLPGMAAIASHLAVLLHERFLSHVIAQIGNGGVALYLHALEKPMAHKHGLYRISTEKILARVPQARIPPLTRRATETLREAWRAFLAGAEGTAAAHLETLVKEGGMLRPESYVWYEFLSDVLALQDVLRRVPADSEEHFRLSFILSIRLQGFDAAAVRRNVFNGNGVVESGRVAEIYVPLVHRVVNEIHARRAFPDDRFDWMNYFVRHDSALMKFGIGHDQAEAIIAQYWQIRFGRYDAAVKRPDEVVWAIGENFFRFLPIRK